MSPSTLARILRYLRSTGCVEVAILGSDTMDDMKKAYKLTPKGKKMAPMFKALEDAENEILNEIGK